MQLKNKLQAGFTTTKNLCTPETAELVYDFLRQLNQNWRPVYSDDFKKIDLEDKNKFMEVFFDINKFSKYSLDDFLNRQVTMSSVHLYLDNKSKTSELALHSSRRSLEYFNYIYFNITDYLNDSICEKLLILYKKLYQLVRAVYGKVCLIGEYDNKHGKIKLINWKATLKKLKISGYIGEHIGIEVSKHIPGIYWLTFFSPLYVNWLGEDVFKKIECTKKEKLPDGGYMLMRGASPFDWQKKETKKMEQQMIKLIGEDKVWQKKNPRTSYLTPEFDLSEFDLTPLMERKMPIMEDYGKVFIPDPLDFIKKAPERAEKIKATFTAKGYPLTDDLRGVNYMEGFNLEDPVLADQPLSEVDEELIRGELSFFGETIKKLFRGEWQKGKNEQGEDSALIVFTAKNGQEIKIDLLGEFIPRWQDVNALTDYLLEISKEAGFDHKL